MGMEGWAPVQAELEATFMGGYPPSVGGERLGPVLNGEHAYGEWLVTTFHGYRVLIDSFFDFFAETLDLAAGGDFASHLPEDDGSYALLFVHVFTGFRSFRAVEAVMNRGYPLAGFSLLRDSKDRAIHLGAVVKGLTTVQALLGADIEDNREKLTEKKLENAAKRRWAEGTRITKLMVGKDSGLSNDDISELDQWRNIFHTEVHGALFTYFETVRTIFLEKKLPTFAPGPHHKNIDASAYMNRATEVGWMMLRVFPYLQIKPLAFGGDWARKWRLLDHAFHLQVKELGENGLVIAQVFMRLMEAKFASSPESAYETE